MIVRFFSALGWISLIFTMVILLVSYANYPSDVLVYVDAVGEPQLYLSKGMLFYMLLVFLMLMNAVVVGVKVVLRNIESSEQSQVGIHLSQIFFNFFFASSVYFINILNSRENFNYSNFGYLIYITGILMTLAIVFSLVSRFILKK